MPDEKVDEETPKPVEETLKPVEEKPKDPPPKSVKDLDYWKTRSRQNEQASKRNAEKAKQFDEWQESQKSEDEKRVTENEDLRSKLASLNLQVLRQQVAAEKKLEPELADTLTGNTAEEMGEHADRLLAAIQRSYAPKQVLEPSDTGAGASGGDTIEQSIAAAESKGDWAETMRLKNQALLRKGSRT